MSRRRSSVLLLWIGALCCAGCGGEVPSGGTRADDPEALRASLPVRADLNVVVVSIEALRPDSLGIHGRADGVSPHIDRLAETSLVFENAYSASPTTPTAFAAMFTGLHPSRVFHAWKLVHDDTLAARFGRAGYRTAGFLNNVNLTAEQNFGAGFDDYTHLRNVADEDAVAQALKWIEENRSHPFFAWVHLLGPHAPYDYRKESARLYEPDYRGEYELSSGPSFETDDPREIARLRSLYDGEVHHADRVLGDLVSGMEALGLLADTVLVVTSDHGEEFGEKGGFQHGKLYEDHVRIPLVIRHPDVPEPRRSNLLVSNLSLFPTLLSLAGIDFESAADGVDLTRLETPPDTLVATSMTGDRDYGRWLSIRRGSHKLIQTCVPTREREFFDLAEDPAEGRNLAETSETRIVELHHALTSIVGGGDDPCRAVDRSIAGSAPVALDEAAFARLRAPAYPEEMAPIWTRARRVAQASLNRQRVLLLGLDGITFRVLDPLFEAGSLPHMAELARKGVRADLWAEPPLVSPAIWTEIATGRRRADHGISGHTVKLVGQAGVTPVVSSLRRSKALWNIVGDWSKRTAVSGYLVTYPCEVYAGSCISYHPTVADVASFEPDSLQSVLEETLGPAVKEIRPTLQKLADWPDTSDYESHPRETAEFRVGRALHRVRRDIQGTLWVLRATEQLAAVEKADLTMFYTHVTDEAGHLFWRYFEPEAFPDPTDPEELAKLRNALPGTYEFADGVLGELMETLGPDLNVIVASDHGMRADPNPIVAFGTNPLLEELGWLVYEKKERGEKVVDYGRTKVYDETEFFAPKRGLFLNLAGREAEGIVSEAEFEGLRAEVIETLSALKTRTGKPVYTTVASTTSTDDRGVQEFDVALVANHELSRDDEILLGDGRVLPVARLFWSTGTSGNHEPNGVLLAAGPAFKAGVTIEKASVLDLAPTILAILGIPVSEEMAGRVWVEALDEKLLADFPIETIATHEDPSREETGPVDGITDEDSLEERMQRLRELGYIVDESQ